MTCSETLSHSAAHSFRHFRLHCGPPSAIPIRTRSIIPGTTLWLSSVVLAELFAGARSGSIRIIEKLERDFARVQRVLTPNGTDWVATGRILAKVGAKYGFDQIGRARLTNDTLIAVSAARVGIEIVTANPKDFARIAEFRQFRWEMLEQHSKEIR
jgi:predicted nucleic acid-binding protein